MFIGKKRGRGRPRKNAPTTSKEIYENPDENVDEEYTLEEDTWKIEDESLSNENEEVKMEVTIITALWQTFRVDSSKAFGFYFT